MASAGGSKGGSNGGAGKPIPPSLGLGVISSPPTPSTGGMSGGARSMGMGAAAASAPQHPSSLARSPTSEVLDSLDYMFDNLSIVVVGASGDLAKKKVRCALIDD